MARLQFAAVLTLGWVVCSGQWTAAGETPPPAPAADQASDAEADTFARIRQLIQAGEHLEAAGALDLAREARAQAESLLAQEAARMAREQEQLEELSRDLVPTQIMVQALIVEAKELPDDLLARMISQRGGELIRPELSDGHVQSALILPEGSSGSEEIRGLADIAEIDVLSRPQVLALDGTLAQIQIGRSVPIVIGFTTSESGVTEPIHETHDAGITLSITPTTVSDGRIHLELLFERAEFSESSIPVFTDPAGGAVITSPVRDVMSVQSAFTVPDGRALFFPVTPPSVDGVAADTEPTLLLILRPRVVKRGE